MGLYLTRPHRKLHLFQFSSKAHLEPQHFFFLLFFNMLSSSLFWPKYERSLFYRKPLILECIQSPCWWSIQLKTKKPRQRKKRNWKKKTSNKQNKIQKRIQTKKKIVVIYTHYTRTLCALWVRRTSYIRLEYIIIEHIVIFIIIAMFYSKCMKQYVVVFRIK